MTFFLNETNLDINEKVTFLKTHLFEAKLDIEATTVMWNCVKNFEKSVQVDILFPRKDEKVFPENILSRVVESDLSNNENIILRHFLEVATNLLKEDEFLKMILGEPDVYFQFYKDASFYKGVLGVIWEAAKSKLSSENLKKLAIGSDEEGNTIPIYFHHELLSWLEDVKTLLSDIELSELLTAKNKLGQIMFHNQVPDITFEDFKKLWKFVPENLKEAGQRKLIFHENNEKRMLIELSIENKDNRISDCIFVIMESLLEKEGKNTIAYFKERGLLVDFIFDIVVWSQPIFEKISLKLKSAELRAIFLSKTSIEESILHILVWHYNEDHKSIVWNLTVNKINDVQAIKKLLYEIDPYHKRNVFHLAAFLGRNILIEILDWCKISFIHEDLKNIFLEKNQESGFTLMHQWCENWDEKFATKGFAFVEENFSSEERELILSLKDDQNRTPRTVFEEKQEAFRGCKE